MPLKAWSPSTDTPTRRPIDYGPWVSCVVGLWVPILVADLFGSLGFDERFRGEAGDATVLAVGLTVGVAVVIASGEALAWVGRRIAAWRASRWQRS